MNILIRRVVDNNIPYRWKFSRFLRSNTSSQKICSCEKFFLQNFLLSTSRAQCLRAADPVNQQKVDAFCRRSIEQIACFATYDQLAATANRSSELAPSLWHGGFSLSATYTLYKRGNVTIVSTLKIYAVGHHFLAGNCRGCGQTSWPCHEIKKREICFLACLLVIRENLCSWKYGIS